MGRQIIKVDPQLDLYVGWSSITESPVYFGSRDEVLDLFADELIQWADRSDLLDGGVTAAARARYRRVAEEAMQRADEYGSSSVQLGMTWGARVIFMQRGYLDRDGLRHLVELLINDPAGEQADPSSYDGAGWIQPFESEAYGLEQPVVGCPPTPRRGAGSARPPVWTETRPRRPGSWRARCSRSGRPRRCRRTGNLTRAGCCR